MPLSLADSISVLSNQAISILNILSGHFTGEKDHLLDEEWFWTLELAIATKDGAS